ncbi:uncharacterized protein BKA78DRAFT_69381 [Phyllosticta capitalensis]|uniref:Uncharacterized protein n=1 Tax=Phyllosticta capitalensis TaxID=121624 RepID=A0ABR1YXV8_9PEZI
MFDHQLFLVAHCNVVLFARATADNVPLVCHHHLTLPLSNLAVGRLVSQPATRLPALSSNATRHNATLPATPPPPPQTHPTPPLASCALTNPKHFHFCAGPTATDDLTDRCHRKDPLSLPTLRPTH